MASSRQYLIKNLQVGMSSQPQRSALTHFPSWFQALSHQAERGFRATALPAGKAIGDAVRWLGNSEAAHGTARAMSRLLDPSAKIPREHVARETAEEKQFNEARRARDRRGRFVKLRNAQATTIEPNPGPPKSRRSKKGSRPRSAKSSRKPSNKGSRSGSKRSKSAKGSRSMGAFKRLPTSSPGNVVRATQGSGLIENRGTRIRVQGDRIIASGTDFFTTLTLATSGSPGDILVNAMPVRPAMIANSVLNVLASMFEFFKFRNLIVHYAPDSAYTDTGIMAGWFDPDPTDTVPNTGGGSSVIEAATTHGGKPVSTKDMVGWSIHQNARRAKYPVKDFYCGGTHPVEMLMQGNFNICYVTIPSNARSVPMWLTWECEFYSLQIDANVSGSQPSTLQQRLITTSTGLATATAANPFGVGSPFSNYVSAYYAIRDFAFWTSSTDFGISFGPTWVGSNIPNLVVEIDMTGTGFTGATISIAGDWSTVWATGTNASSSQLNYAARLLPGTRGSTSITTTQYVYYTPNGTVATGQVLATDYPSYTHGFAFYFHMGALTTLTKANLRLTTCSGGPFSVKPPPITQYLANCPEAAAYARWQQQHRDEKARSYAEMVTEEIKKERGQVVVADEAKRLRALQMSLQSLLSAPSADSDTDAEVVIHPRMPRNPEAREEKKVPAASAKSLLW